MFIIIQMLSAFKFEIANAKENSEGGCNNWFLRSK